MKASDEAGIKKKRGLPGHGPCERFQRSRPGDWIRAFALSCGNSDGFLLPGLIFTMVLFSVLAAAIVPMTGSSVFSRIGANSSQRAYYLAESGYRYAASQYIHGGVTENERDDMLETLHNNRYRLSETEQFQLYMHPYFYKTTSNPEGSNQLVTKINGENPPGRTIPTSGRIQIFVEGFPVAGPYDYTEADINDLPNVTFIFEKNTTLPSIVENATVFPMAISQDSGQTISRNGDLVLSDPGAADAFPPYNGTFSLGSGDTVYHFSKRDGDTLCNIKSFANPDNSFQVKVPGGTDVVLRKYLAVKSVGTFGSGVAKSVRSITYKGPIAALPIDQAVGGGGGGPTEVDLSGLADPDQQGATSMGEFAVAYPGGDEALSITKTTGGSGSGNQPSVEAYVSHASGVNPFYQLWNHSGHYLSYDAQVKIGTGIWSEAGTKFTDKPGTYCAGVTMRTGLRSNQSTFYGISFMRSGTANGQSSDGIQDTMIPSSTLEDQAMIVFWTRNSNQGNGDNNWLAYRTLSSGDHVVDASGYLTDWSTILVRVVEAASIKLTVDSALLVSVGETITGGSGSAKVVRKINDSDGRVVLLLNNVSEGFVRPTTVKEEYETDSGWGYRDRDTYIWVFCGDPDEHLPADPDPLNNMRKDYARSSTLKWPTPNMADWTAGSDDFTLVQWNSSLNTSQDSALRLMGTGKEAGAIIRTQKWGTDSFTSDTPEVGLVSLGDSSVYTCFDDFAYKLESSGGGSGGVGTGFLGSIQQ